MRFSRIYFSDGQRRLTSFESLGYYLNYFIYFEELLYFFTCNSVLLGSLLTISILLCHSSPKSETAWSSILWQIWLSHIEGLCRKEGELLATICSEKVIWMTHLELLPILINTGKIFERRLEKNYQPDM